MCPESLISSMRHLHVYVSHAGRDFKSVSALLSLDATPPLNWHAYWDGQASFRRIITPVQEPSCRLITSYGPIPAGISTACNRSTVTSRAGSCLGRIFTILDR